MAIVRNVMANIMSEPKIALVGNPNVGKSVIFGFMTGRYVTVSNYPGTTVEVSRGRAQIAGQDVEIVDTPGINTLVPMSEDERATRNILLNEKFDAVLQVCDAKNLRRGLLITLQLIEMGVPVLLDLNMEDEVTSRGISIDKVKLAALLKIKVKGSTAIQKRGLSDIQKEILTVQPSEYRFSYSQPIEQAIATLTELLPTTFIAKRSIALMLLAGDRSLTTWLHQYIPDEKIKQIDDVCHQVARQFVEGLSYVIYRQRSRYVEEICHGVITQEKRQEMGWAVWLGKWSTHPIGGVFMLLAVLLILYEFVGVFGAGTAVGWLENGVFNGWLNPLAIRGFAKLFYFSPFMRDIFVGPYGIITMGLTYSLAIILPIVVTFFIAFSIMEDSGYLPRLAIMMNRIFKWMGLNGKAVVPMVLGLGCDTMATMTARIMDTRKERIILTLLLALGIPCSAQLGIILGMLSALPAWMTLLWLGVVTGVLFLVGSLASMVVPGHSSDFIMEIPPIRRPMLLNIMTKTMARLEWYLKEVVPLFVIGTLALFFLDRLGVLPVIRNFAHPFVTGFLGLPDQATDAFLIGFLRRDYGATHFFDMFNKGQMDSIQAIVSLIVMTLFVPCLANALMIVKERGMAVMVAIVGFIYPFAFLVGGIVNWTLRL